MTAPSAKSKALLRAVNVAAGESPTVQSHQRWIAATTEMGAHLGKLQVVVDAARDVLRLLEGNWGFPEDIDAIKALKDALSALAPDAKTGGGE